MREIDGDDGCEVRKESNTSLGREEEQEEEKKEAHVCFLRASERNDRMCACARACEKNART